MKTDFQKSTEQGNLYSNSNRKIFTNNFSIISRLHARSLTGRNLQMQVQRHLGYRLRTVWQTNPSKYTSPSRGCLQRKITATDEMEKFCQELIIGGSEHLCNCLGESFPEILEGKVRECYRAQNSKRLNLAHIGRSMMRSYHECDRNRYWCNCNSPSSCVYELRWEVPFETFSFSLSLFQSL
jgi:hypothetical protein